jgi:hypothetical protein
MTAALANGMVQDGLAPAHADGFPVAGSTHMNRVLMLVLVLGAALPAVARAQSDGRESPAQLVLAGYSTPAQSATPAPVTLDLGLGDSTWVQRINDNPAPSQINPALPQANPTPSQINPALPQANPNVPPTSPGAAALNAQVNTQPMPGQNYIGDCGNNCCDNGCNNCCQTSCWPPPGVFCNHTFDLEYLTGYWTSITNRGLPRLGVQYTSVVPEIVRLGMIWNDTNDCRDRWRGSFEGIIELDCLPIVSGPGTIVIGGSLLLRYNWSHRHKRLVPYFQFGGGGQYTDAWMFPASPTGTGFNFILQLGGGFHYFINDRWALTAEADYFHMSNSGISPNNLGLNFVNGLFGLTYYFGRNMH